MKKLLIAACLLLSACAPPPLPFQAMKAPDTVYGQVKKDGFYLQNKLAMGTVETDMDSKNMAILYSEAGQAIQASLSHANLLSADPAKATYLLSAHIKDVGYPRCFFGTCETGATIEYTLSNIKSQTVAYQEMLVVPHNFDYPVFGANMPIVYRQALAGAIGENTAHLIHVLTNKTQADLRGAN